MTKNNIIFKSLKYNLKNHLSLILSYIFISFIIYQLGVILCNADYNITGIKPMVVLLYVTLVIFSFVFINYVIIAYNKSRSKEFGIYLSLGLEKKDIYKSIFIENTILMVISSVIGIGISMIITQSLDIIITDIEYFDKISLHFNILNLFMTIVILMLMYIFTNVNSIRKIKKSNITYIINDENIGNKTTGKFILLLLGCILFISIFFIGILDVNNMIDSTIISNMRYVLYFIAIYLIISNASYFFNYKAKKNVKYYYNNILHLMDINYMFNQYKRVVYLTSITVFIGLLISGSMAGSFYTNLDYTRKMNPNDLQIIQSKDEIFNYKELDLNLQAKYEFDAVSYDGNFYIDNNTIDEDLKTDIITNRDEAVIYGLSQEVDIRKDILLNNEEIINIQIKGNEDKVLINGYQVYGVSKEIFSKMKSCSEEYHIVTFLKDKNIELKEKILIDYINLNKLDVKVKSATMGSKNAMKDQISYSFLILLLTITFFFASGAVMYFKVFIDIDKNKKKFMKLKLLGTERKDIIKTIKKDISLIFIMTYIFGGLSAYIWLIISFSNRPHLFISMIGLSLWFVLFTLIIRFFYIIVTRKLIRINC